jgi:hypothetical protein
MLKHCFELLSPTHNQSQKLLSISPEQTNEEHEDALRIISLL